MTDEQIIKAWDILAKLDFFGGQRAGRELWCEKPVDIQNEDIENFKKDIAFLKEFINRQKAEIERLKQDRYFVKENGEIELMPRTDIEKIKAEAIKEFAERLKEFTYKGFWETHGYVSEAEIDRVTKEMVGDNDAENT